MSKRGRYPWRINATYECTSPNGANVTAYYHTHGAYDPGYRSEYFSNTNGEGYIPFAKDQKMDGYLATPMGKLKYYNYANDVIKVLQQ